MIRFLSLEEVIDLHQDAIAEYGGDPGIRDSGLLESAIAQPMAMFAGEYLHSDLAEMAAAYLFHLAMNHAFVDGNKRIAAYAAGVFLDLNGAELLIENDALEELVLAVARGQMQKPEIAQCLRSKTRFAAR